MKKENRKKRCIWRILIILIPVIACFCPFHLSGSSRMRKGRFYLKVTGGADFLNSGDFGRMIDTNASNNENLSKIKKNAFFWSYGGELGYSFKRFSAGIEVSKVLTYFTAQFDDNDFIGPWDQKFFAIPVLLNIHFKLVGSPSVNVYLNGGVGYTLGNIETFGGGNINPTAISTRWVWKSVRRGNGVFTWEEQSNSPFQKG